MHRIVCNGRLSKGKNNVSQKHLLNASLIQGQLLVDSLWVRRRQNEGKMRMDNYSDEPNIQSQSEHDIGGRETCSKSAVHVSV